MLRVVGGKYKRRKLDQPSLEITRPTKDMVKEAMFSSLGDLSNKSFLDCFGGSGAIGIEAYSRGATPVTIIENSLEAFKIIKTNLKNLNINDINVIYKDFTHSLISFFVPRFNRLPSVITASGADGCNSFTVLPNPLPPDVAKSTIFLPLKS